MQRKFIIIFMLLIYFYIDTVRTAKINNNQSAIITSGQITKIKKSEKISKFEAYSSHPSNNTNSTGSVLFSEIKSNNNTDIHGENSTDKLLTIKEKNNSVNAANSLKLMNKTDYDLDENDSDTFKEANQSVQASHKSFVRQVNSKTHGDNVRVYENPEESSSTKSYSEKDFVPSPEFKIDHLNSDEHRNFDTFQPINIGGYNRKIEHKQEFHQNYHHLTENPYHKFEQNSRQKFPSENEEYDHAHVTHTSVTNYKPSSTKNTVVHQQLIPSYSSISWPEYQHTDVEKNHHFDQHNVENKYKNSEIEITNFKQHHDHDLQSYNNDHHYASTSEIPPAPVTEDVRDIRSEHPYPFEIVTEKEKEIKFNHDAQKEYEIRYPHDEIIYTTASTSPPTNFKNHHVTEIWDSKHVPDHHIKNPGKILPKQEPWKDILQVLTAIVPIGLLLTALTPNVIVVNPNATVPINHHPLGFGSFNLHTKQRSNSEKTNEPFNKNLNEISNLLLHNNLKTTLTNSKCIERAFCELSRKSDNSNTEKLKELLELIVKRNQGLQQVDDSMFELVETAKNNNCLRYQCDENIYNV